MCASRLPPGWPAGLPLPDLSRAPPPWLLPPPPPGMKPPPPPPGGWARSWDVRRRGRRKFAPLVDRTT
jgi:hypothetical protein